MKNFFSLWFTWSCHKLAGNFYQKPLSVPVPASDVFVVPPPDHPNGAQPDCCEANSSARAFSAMHSSRVIRLEKGSSEVASVIKSIFPRLQASRKPPEGL